MPTPGSSDNGGNRLDRIEAILASIAARQEAAERRQEAWEARQEAAERRQDKTDEQLQAVTARLDALGVYLGTMAGRHDEFERELKRLLAAQVVLNDQLGRLSEKVDQIGDNVNAVIRVVDSLVQGRPPRPGPDAPS